MMLKTHLKIYSLFSLNTNLYTLFSILYYFIQALASTTQTTLAPDARNEITREVADVGSHVNVSSIKNAFNPTTVTSTTGDLKKSGLYIIGFIYIYIYIYI